MNLSKLLKKKYQSIENLTKNQKTVLLPSCVEYIEVRERGEKEREREAGRNIK